MRRCAKRFIALMSGARLALMIPAIILIVGAALWRSV